MILELMGTKIFGICFMGGVCLTPVIALWFEIFKRKPYVDGRKDEPY